MSDGAFSPAARPAGASGSRMLTQPAAGSPGAHQRGPPRFMPRTGAGSVWVRVGAVGPREGPTRSLLPSPLSLTREVGPVWVRGRTGARDDSPWASAARPE